MTKWDLALGMDRDNKEHQQLSMEMLEVWASTMVSLLQQYIVLMVDVCVPLLKGDSIATEESPPNHCSFDVVTHISITSECTALLGQRSGFGGLLDCGFSLSAA